MNAFFVNELLPYSKKIYDYFESVKFLEITTSIWPPYLIDNYLDVLIKYCKGGKCIRAYLVYLGYKIAGGKNYESVLAPASSYEIFEASILAHDDIIDRSPTRRFGPSMYTYLGNNHYGISRTICIGDAGIVLANSIIEQSIFSNDIKIKALNHQNRIFSYTLAGELRDIELSHASIYSESEIIEMYLLKTAWYTIIGPLVLGAILAGTDEIYSPIYTDFGYKIGIAFQIQDDILGIYGSEERIGKSILSDASEGKKSIITSYFNENANAIQKAKFYSIYGKDNLTIKDLEQIRNILEESGCLSYAKKKIDEYVNDAVNIIDSSNIEIGSQQLLKNFSQYILHRSL